MYSLKPICYINGTRIKMSYVRTDHIHERALNTRDLEQELPQKI